MSNNPSTQLLTRYPAFLRVAAVLDALVRRELLATLLGGVGLVLLYLFAAVLVRCLMDYWLHFDWTARAALLVCDIGVCAWLIRRFIWLPLRGRLTRTRAALRLQAYAPELESRLISSLQLAPEVDAGRAPRSLVERLLMSAVVALDEVSWKEAVVLKNAVLLAAGAGVLALGIIGWAVIAPASSGVLIGRYFLSSHPPLYRTLLEVTSGDLKTPRGDAVTLAVSTGGEVPRQVVFVLEDDTGARESFTVGSLPDDPTRFELVIENAQNSFGYQVLGGDARSADFRVEVLEAPVLEELQIRVSPPAYTGHAAYALPASELQMIEGSSLTLQGHASDALSAARLVLIPGDPLAPASSSDEGTMAANSGAAEVEESPAAGAGSFPLKTDGIALSGQAREISPQTAYVSVSLTGENGVQSVDDTRYPIKWVLDLAPVITLAKAPAEGATVAEGRTATLNGAVREDYALETLQLCWQVQRPGEAAAAPIETHAVPFSGEANAFDLLLVPGGGAVGADAIAINAPAGSSVTWWLEAVDNRDLTGGPQHSQSDPMMFKVVTVEEKIAELMGRIRDNINTLENVSEQQAGAKSELESYLESNPNSQPN
ncbi:MAG: hypothetical protein Q7Q73_09525 [Verrucomicrobiota bacterium JB024]|nr:hypothetical protein [Verrucomicrobiota bacterium JB024]